jgi:hypothetical protein
MSFYARRIDIVMSFNGTEQMYMATARVHMFKKYECLHYHLWNVLKGMIL